MSTVKRLYRCPRCGDVLTDAEYEELLTQSGMGYCYCEYGAPYGVPDEGFQRILHEYEVFVKETAGVDK
jgi:hypothetical protein